MKKSSVKKIMLVIALMAIVCLISNINYATGSAEDLLKEIYGESSDGTTTGTGTAEDPEQITVVPGTDDKQEQDKSGQEKTTQEPTTTTKTEDKEEETKKETTLPKTGVDDTMLFVLMAVSIVAAGYTYKKVRDYNV